MAASETVAEGANGLAHLTDVGLSRKVRVDGVDNVLSRTLIAAQETRPCNGRQRKSACELITMIGLIVPYGIGAEIEHELRSLLIDHADPDEVALSPLTTGAQLGLSKDWSALSGGVRGTTHERKRAPL